MENPTNENKTSLKKVMLALTAMAAVVLPSCMSYSNSNGYSEQMSGVSPIDGNLLVQAGGALLSEAMRQGHQRKMFKSYVNAYNYRGMGNGGYRPSGPKPIIPGWNGGGCGNSGGSFVPPPPIKCAQGGEFRPTHGLGNFDNITNYGRTNSRSY